FLAPTFTPEILEGDGLVRSQLLVLFHQRLKPLQHISRDRRQIEIKRLSEAEPIWLKELTRPRMPGIVEIADMACMGDEEARVEAASTAWRRYGAREEPQA